MSTSISLWVGKVRRNLDTFSWPMTLWKLANQALVGPFYKQVSYRIYRADVDSLATRESTGDDVAIALLDQNDQEAIRVVEYHAEWLQGRLRSLLDGGALCVIARQGEQVIGFNILLVGKVLIGVIQWQREFRSKQAWSEHLWVHRDFRGRGLATRIRLGAYQQLRRRGVRSLYGGALLSNKASLKSANKSGFVDVADVEYSRILGRKRWRFKRVSR